ncbi:hypothetical protein C8035_v011660 [Colletotrichum spinosum]|uniref:Uncharacterized protein n=1 Tax=Colletotrichum spinosum TaxID=1347390 RepID=A0A4V3HRT0_9PEZI|nr:hypothetical protein C8035_v011660 [Colletotrichum spinosum]
MRPALILVILNMAVIVIAEGCHGDNLLRALERFTATSYCSAFLGGATATLSVPEGIPTTYESFSVSSACSCVLGIYSTSAGAPCHSQTAGDDVSASAGVSETSTSKDPVTTTLAAEPSSRGVVAPTLAVPTTLHPDDHGGYSYSLPVPVTTSGESTCGWGDATTTTVQVTETSVKTNSVFFSTYHDDCDYHLWGRFYLRYDYFVIHHGFFHPGFQQRNDVAKSRFGES